MHLRIYVPCLGPGETVTVTDDESAQPEGNEVLWYESEVDALIEFLDSYIALPEADLEDWRKCWIRYIDAAKRMYPGIRFTGFNPLTTQPCIDTVNFPWQTLPRK